MNKIVEVRLWETTIGYLGYSPGQTETATFQFDDDFMNSNIQISPLVMPYMPAIHEFPDISRRTFHGLPGIIADSLPDRFGNQLIDMYMAEKGFPPERVTALDRLLYMGTRGMGALEYQPAAVFNEPGESPTALDIPSLSELAELILNSRREQSAAIINAANREQALQLIRVGSSAGGARSKAIVAVDADGRIFDGGISHQKDLRYMLLKFDNEQNSDRDHNDPPGMTRIEYIYAKIAGRCGIDIPGTDFIEDGDRFHFLIERFDRSPAKHFYASWAGLSHADRDTAGAYSYEQLILTARQLGIAQDGVKELFRRALFNIIGRNQDDHTKNFGFMMNRSGEFRVSPAFDLTYSFDPSGRWTRMHQLKLNGKQDNFDLNDIISFGNYCNLSEKQSLRIITQTEDAFSSFAKLADKYAVSDELKQTIIKNIRRLTPYKG